MEREGDNSELLRELKEWSKRAREACNALLSESLSKEDSKALWKVLTPFHLPETVDIPWPDRDSGLPSVARFSAALSLFERDWSEMLEDLRASNPLSCESIIHHPSSIIHHASRSVLVPTSVSLLLLRCVICDQTDDQVGQLEHEIFSKLHQTFPKAKLLIEAYTEGFIPEDQLSRRLNFLLHIADIKGLSSSPSLHPEFWQM